jgi:hypothetical protein
MKSARPAFSETWTVRERLAAILRHVEGIEQECSGYGGWAGKDKDAKVALDLGLRLASLGHAVALYGRAAAEGDDA